MLTYYLSTHKNLNRFIEQSGLALDEIITLVGRFKSNSKWAGEVRGEAVVDTFTSRIKLRHHFNKKILWVGELND